MIHDAQRSRARSVVRARARQHGNSRIWTVLARGQNYQLRDPNGQPITTRAAKTLIAERFTVPAEVRKRARAHSAATHRGRLTR